MPRHEFFKNYCRKCGGVGIVWDRRVGQMVCPECHGTGREKKDDTLDGMEQKRETPNAPLPGGS